VFEHASTSISISTNSPSPNATITRTHPSDTPSIQHSAILSKIVNLVTARATSPNLPVPPSEGMTLFSGGEIATAEDSRARTDLLSEGTPNSALGIPLPAKEQDLRLRRNTLLWGEIIILLNGCSLEVEASPGIAAVRRGLLSVKFDPDIYPIPRLNRTGYWLRSTP
jgi:hypothetical protein